MNLHATMHLITAPSDPVVTLDEAKAQLRVTDSDSDDLIAALIAAATGELDAASNGWLGRALRPQTWELRCDGFPYCNSRWHESDYSRTWYRRSLSAIDLRFPPLVSVTSVKYDDGDGAEQTLVEGTGFRVFNLGDRQTSYVAPLFAGVWPSSVRCDPESVRVRYVAGYGVSPDVMPAQIKQAVMLMVKDLFSMSERSLFVSAETVDGVGSRSFVVTDNARNVIRSTAEDLLSTLRIYE